MAAVDLITNARALYNLHNQTLSGAQTTTVNALITACSRAIADFCQRDFVTFSYDELYSGRGQRELILRQYPVQSVQSVRYRPVTVLKIQCTRSTNDTPQARVEVLNTGLRLTRVTSGVQTQTTTGLTFAANVTITALAAAVNAADAGNWSAQGQGYDNWPSADLYSPNSNTIDSFLAGQGALTAAGQFAELKMHTYELAGYQINNRSGWLLRAIPYTDPELLHPEDLVWPTGINNFRVQYTAGYTAVPEQVQEACAIWVAESFYRTTRDPGLPMQKTADFTQQTDETVGTPAPMPDTVRRLLEPRKSRNIMIAGG